MTPRIDLTSFDVFDTVLTRKVGEPQSLFHILGHRLVSAGLWPAGVASFAAARMSAEAAARRALQPTEVTLMQIYAQLAFGCGWSSERARQAQEHERRLEGELLYAVPQAKAAVERARLSGEAVAFISDIYLPGADVAHWLESRGLLCPPDSVWASSESLHTKASGALFDEVRRALRPSSWCHIGDNAWSDVEVPRGRDINARHWQPCSLTRYERAMESHALATEGVSSLLAGASRWLRLNHHADNEGQRVMRDIASGVAGPVLWSFVTWVLQTVMERGLDRIWFVGRDGQVMLRMARKIAPGLGFDIDMGYLYGGRQVVHLAALQQIDERALNWMTGGAGVATAASLLQRVGLTQEQVADELARHGIAATGPIGWGTDAALRSLFGEPTVQALILETARDRRKAMRDYYSACGLIGPGRAAVVDIGWRGNVLRSLFDILGHDDASRQHFLYFGLLGRPTDVPTANMSAYCFDASCRPPLGSGHEVASLPGVMEIFCQGDHPQVLHVECHDGEFVPVFGAAADLSGGDWDIRYFQKCLEAYAEALPAYLVAGVRSDLRPLSVDLLKTLVLDPARDEAHVLGGVRFVDDQSGGRALRYCFPFDLRDFPVVVRTGRLPAKSIAWWEQGAWVMTNRATQVLLKAALRFGEWRATAAVV
jgi:FMN phosphatase YigB (HAD superfamily)